MDKTRAFLYSTGMEFLVFLLYGTFFVCLYPQVLFSGHSFYKPDIYTFYYPVWELSRESIRSGVFPFWNPYSAFGAPFFANVQTCVLYPGAALFYALPFPFAFNLYILLHLALACFGTYRLARELGLTGPGAFYAGLMFGLSGYVGSVTHLVITLASIAYFPWALAAALRLGEGVTKNRVLLLALIFLLQYLAGDPAVLFMTVSVIFVAASARTLEAWSRKKTLDPSFFKAFFLSFFLFLGLSAFQSLPFFEFLSASTRPEQSLSDASTWSSQWETLVTFFIPRFHELAEMVQAGQTSAVMNFGVRKQIWLSNPYAGVVPLFFAFYAVMVKRKPAALWLTALAALGIGVSFGHGSWTYQWIYRILPPFQWIRFPVRFLFPFYFAVALLAAMGLETLLQTGPANGKKNRWVPLVLLTGAALLALNSLQPLKNLVQSFANRVYGDEIVSKFYSVELTHQIVSRIAASAQRSLVLLSACFLLLLLRHKRTLFLFLFGLLAVGDLVPMNANEPTAPAAALTAHGPVIDLLRRDPSLFRAMPSPRMVKKMYESAGAGAGQVREQADKLSPNLHLAHRLHLVWNYDSVFLKSAIEAQKLLTRKTFEEAQDWLCLLNVKYMLSTESFLSENFVETGNSPVGHLFLNKKVLPRAYWIPENGLDADRNLVPSVVMNRFVGADVRTYGLNRVTMRVRCPDKGWLFFSDIHYPGWTARIDGERSPVRALNGGFRALSMRAGEHDIEWTFIPGSVIIGGLVSFLTAASLLVVLKKRPLGDSKAPKGR